MKKRIKNHTLDVLYIVNDMIDILESSKNSNISPYGDINIKFYFKGVDFYGKEKCKRSN